MARLSRFNPIAISVYFLCALVILMFCSNAFLYGIGFVSGAVMLFMYDKSIKLSDCVFYIALPIICAVVNTLFSHNGVTVLFFLNSNPITVESALYGLFAGVMLSASLMWLRSFSALMDSDKIMYITGALSPKLSLIVSMILRYIPLYRRQVKRTREAHRAMGLTNEDSMPDKIKGGANVFSAMTTWALENGVVTADSMEARGYGCGRRTRYTLYKWKACDGALSALSVLLFSASFVPMLTENTAWQWYPNIVFPRLSPMISAEYICFLILCLLPVGIEIKERLKWRLLQSKI